MQLLLNDVLDNHSNKLLLLTVDFWFHMNNSLPCESPALASNPVNFSFICLTVNTAD